jgi:cysteinyl-tRNA synthetase
MLNFYNTVTRRKEEFLPQQPGEVKMYACGPTVYDYFHVGNARAFVVFDTLRRVLEHKGFHVTYVQNITDVDDKIINRANKEGRTAQAVAEEFTAAFQTDLKALGCRPPDTAPQATQHMDDIIRLVQRLVESGHAYALEGDVYFSVRSFPGYGKISGKNIEELEQGARVEVDTRKRDPLDFALWKTAKPNEPFWESPWGPGRPGWHIECSAMSMKYLGDSFDIHGGGEDLIFPHHENENAQSESVTGKMLARYWLHNGYLKIDGEKMSKSLGNFFTVRDILKKMPSQVLRLLLLSAHYRSPLDFNPENVEGARNGYVELKKTMERLAEILRQTVTEDFLWDESADVLDKDRLQAAEKFEQALEDDLNTAGAIGHLYSLVNKAKQYIASRPAKTRRLNEVLFQVERNLQQMTDVLGIRPEVQLAPEHILLLIAQRNAARSQKNYPESDRIRDLIQQEGYLLEDTVFGSLPILNPDSHPVIIQK